METLQPRGMRDIGPKEKLQRDRMLQAMRRVFELYGFLPLETPILERYETLSAKYAGGAEIMKEMFTLEDQGKRKLGLRYDLTVPLARYIAQNPTVKLPFKRYQIEKVYRDGPIKLGRYREFLQCDCDIVGAASVQADAQCLQLARSVFTALELNAQLACNNMALLRQMLAKDGVEQSQLEQAMLILDKLKKIGKEGVEKELAEANISADITQLIQIAQLPTNKAKITAITARYGESEALSRIERTLELCQDELLVFDPSLSRGLAYYTGIVYEGYLQDSEVSSSVCGGGRYDRMIGDFAGRPDDFPAVGISFGLEPIMDALGTQQEQNTTTIAFLIPIKTPKQASELAQQLRAQDIAVDIDLMERSIGKNLEYAAAQGIPYAILLGEQEIAEAKAKLRDLRTGEERLLSTEELIEALQGAWNQ